MSKVLSSPGHFMIFFGVRQYFDVGGSRGEERRGIHGKNTSLLRKYGLCTIQTDLILALPVMTCVALGKLFNHTELQFH